MTTTAAEAPSTRAAYATNGVGATSAKYRTATPAAASTPTASSAKARLDSRPSKPTITGPAPGRVAAR